MYKTSFEDETFLQVVREDIKQFLTASEDIKRVLLFPPLNSRLRFLIHNFIQENFKEQNLRTFSVGQDSHRRAAVCHTSIIIASKVADTCTKVCTGMLESEMAAASHGGVGGGVRSRSSRMAPSLNLYQPPAVRAAELKHTQSTPVTKPTERSRPRDNSKDDRRNKRPDQQRYIPRPLRSEIGSTSAHKSETVDGDASCRKISPEASSKSTTKTRHSETGTAPSRMPLMKNPEQNTIHSSADSTEIDNSCTKRDKVSEKVSARPVLIRKRHSAPVQSVQSTSSSDENSVESFNSREVSQNNDNIHDSPSKVLDTSIPDASDVENGESSRDDSNISQVTVENGESCSNFETGSNSMTEGDSNQGRFLSNGVDFAGKFKSDSFTTIPGSDVDCSKMEVDTSAQCEQVVPNVIIDNHSQVSSVIKDTVDVFESAESVCKPVSEKESPKSDCLSPSSEKISGEMLNSSKYIDEKHCADDESNTAVHQESMQTPKRIKTEECDDWETLYSDESELIDPVIIEELGESVGKVKIATATSDYRSYQSVEERSNNGECILEIYGFPAEFKTRDLMAAFAAYRNRAGFNIKWVDDTHALAVFNSPLVADEVLMCDLPFVKTRPLRMGLPESRAKARNLILPPAIRPKTCPALAKRLVSGALGLRLQTDKKARETEKMILKEARDKKRMAAKLKEAAWEGTLTSNMQS